MVSSTVSSIKSKTKKLTHLNDKGEARMVDVSEKATTTRHATASATVQLASETFALLEEGMLAKGDVLAVARIAGIQAAKQTAQLIPLCHPLMLSHIDIAFILDKKNHRVIVQGTCRLKGTTGVEMEALTAVSVAALTIYDMCKASDKGIVISDIKLLEKSGGKSGKWKRS